MFVYLELMNWWSGNKRKNKCCVTWTLTQKGSHLRYCVTLNNQTMQGGAETEPEIRNRDIFNPICFTTGSLWVILEECLSTQMSQYFLWDIMKVWWSLLSLLIAFKVNMKTLKLFRCNRSLRSDLCFKRPVLAEDKDDLFIYIQRNKLH